jgi:hypothetical protein
MIERVFGNLIIREEAVPEASHDLEQVGYTLIPDVFSPAEVEQLRAEIDDVFAKEPARDPDSADGSEYRFGMFNRSPAALAAISHPRILEVTEPLLGDDCHVIANTAWRNPPTFEGQMWHTDAGPHVPRPEGVPWDDRIPYPIFVIGCHILLTRVSPAEGATAVVPRSHRSGQPVPLSGFYDPNLSLDGEAPVLLGGEPGDVLLFVSDLWHRGMPADPATSAGREFLQVHYGRRDIAQRVKRTTEVNHVDPTIAELITDQRIRQLLGLHPGHFYDG